MNKFEKFLTGLGAVAGIMSVVALIKKPDSVYKHAPEKRTLWRVSV